MAIRKTHKHGKTSKGSQRYYCLGCQQTFPAECCTNTDHFDTMYYRRQLEP